MVTLATQGGRDTASTNCIPATPIDVFVGGPTLADAKKPRRSTSDNRGLARSVPALNFALKALLKRGDAFGSSGGSKYFL
jgi:hypothetical protein